MSVLGGNPLLLGSGDAAGFTTQRSVRLRSSNTAYFNRTPASAGNRTTWTWSAWVKRGKIDSGTTQYFLLSNNSASNDTGSTFMYFFQDGLRITGFNTSWRQTTQLFRDPSAWYHIVVVWDTTNATALDRVRIYVNGLQVTAFSTTNNPTQNSTGGINAATATYIGADVYLGPANHFDGYLTEVNFIDGQALTPSAFGEYDAVRNTQWKPKRYTGTYGTNGFYLNFSDNSNNTAATIGKDSSGNSNNWTPNGISVTAGIAYDSMTDVPTLTSETASNFATLNPVDTGGGSVTLSGGNLNYSIASGAGSQVRGTIGADLSSKWYWEYTNGTTATALNPVMFGISTVDGQITNNSTSLKLAAVIYTDGVTNYTASKYINGAATTITTQFRSAAIGDIFQIAYDAATGNLWFGKNNTWYDATNGTTGNPSTGANPVFTLPTGSSMTPFLANLGATYTGSLNCGQRPFVQPVPTGFKSLNTYNLPDGNVTSSDDYHKIYSYTGNGGGLQVGEVQKPASLFNLDRSLRFRSSASAFLSRTPASAGNRQKWTWSAWVKRSGLGSEQILFHAYNGSNPIRTVIAIASTDQISFNIADGGYDICTTTQVFRDPAAWFHLCVSLDSTQATPADRLTIEVNGVAVAYSSSVSLNRNGDINTTNLHHISSYGSASFLNGYLADVYFVDGQKLTASNFGTYDGNFYWTPKAYTGTYGTNGFHLEFEDFSASTAAAIGKDTSGQGNNWTPNAGINLTVPENINVSWDSMVDVPTLTSADVANFATLDPIAPDKNISGTGGVYSDGNLKIAANAGASDAIVPTATLGCFNGKFYAEITCITAGSGAAQTTYVSVNALGSGSAVYLAYDKSGQFFNGSTWAAGWASWTANDTIGVSIDQTVNPTSVSFYKNGTLQGTLTTGATVNLTFAVRAAYAASFAYNFGQRSFRFTPPTGFKDLNSFNVAEVLGDVETPDFVWIKSRSASGDHALFNSVVGAGKYFRSNSGNGEVTDVNSLIQFNKNGFLLGNAAIVNTSATTYVASVWKAGNTTVTNTAGTISSQVRANPSAGFSIVTYTGTGANATVGHGLGVAPKMIIIKSKTVVQDWAVYHSNLTSAIYWLQLNGTGTQNNNAAVWNSTAPTSSVFSVGTASVSNATSGLVAYCFADVNGFSKFGSYISNNATDGPFVYTGFRPRWLMVKRAIAASGTGGWFMYDAERNTYNVMDKYIFAEGTAGDNTLAVFDFTSNGFKIRSNNVHVNTTAGDTYIYMAFAEHPFKYSLAR
jgi:hypothetical protein